MLTEPEIRKIFTERINFLTFAGTVSRKKALSNAIKDHSSVQIVSDHLKRDLTKSEEQRVFEVFQSVASEIVNEVKQ